MKHKTNYQLLRVCATALLLLIHPALFAAANISIFPSNQADFGQVLVGTTETLTYTLSNTGDTDLNITNFDTPAGTSDFSIMNNCSSLIAAGSNCTVVVSYTANLGGSDTNFTVVSNDPDEGIVNRQINGTGVNTATNRAPIAPALLAPANSTNGINPGSITLYWQEAIDAENNPLTYSVSICTNDGFLDCNPEVVAMKNTVILFAAMGGGTGIMMLGMIAPLVNRKQRLAVIMLLLLSSLMLGSCSSGKEGKADTGGSSNNTSKTISGLTAATTYFWKVSVSDGATTVESETRNFKTL